MNKKIFLIFIFVWAVFFLAGLKWNPHQRPTGDEPHYLIIAQSLIKDHDLDLKNNYEQKDYRKWGYPIEDFGQGHVSVNSIPPYQYSVHNIGWPLIFAPFLALDGRNGITFLTSFLTALLFLNIFLLVKKVTQNSRVGLIIAIVTGFSVPVIIYATQIFSEIFTALLVLYVFRKVIDKSENLIGQILPILAISFLPWIHVKYLLISLVLLILWVINNWRAKKRLFLTTIYIISLLILGYLFKHWYGSFSPNAQYPSVLAYDFKHLGQGILALFMDRTFGILAYAPVYFMALAGLYFLYLENKLLTLKLSVVFLSLFLVQAVNAPMIGWAPAGRFLVTVLSLLSIPMAKTYLNLKHWSKIIFWHLTGWGWLVSYLLIRHPDLNYSLSEPQFLKAISPPIFAFYKFFPTLLSVEHYPPLTGKTIFLLIFWLLLILGFNLVLILSNSKTKSNQKA